MMSFARRIRLHVITANQYRREKMKKILTHTTAAALIMTSLAQPAAADRERVIGYDRDDIRWVKRSDRSTLEDDIVDLANLFTDRDLDKEFLDERNYDRDGRYIGHPVFGDGNDFCPPGQAKKGRC